MDAHDHTSSRPTPTDHGAPAVGGVLPVDLRDYARFSPDEATRVRVLAGATLAVDLWCIEPQQATAVLHLEDRDVVYTVLGGRSWFVTDDGEIGLDPMGTMSVPAGTVHGIDNRAPDPLIVLAVSSPPSDEPVEDPVEPVGAAVRHDPEGPGWLRQAIRSLFGATRVSD
jgi:quercetin dioxygenase-like cupin family protein